MSFSSLVRAVAGIFVGALLAGAREVKSEAIAPGLDYSRLELAGPVVAHVVRLDLEADGLRVRSVKARGKETVHEIETRMEDDSTRVLAAINGDFFRQRSIGLPFGAQISDGRLIFSPVRRSLIAFAPANRPTIEVATLQARMTLAPKAPRGGAHWMPIDAVNPVADQVPRKGVYLYTSAFPGLKVARPQGQIVVVDPIEPGLQVGRVCEGKVDRVEPMGEEVDVPDTGGLLYFAGDAARSQAARLVPGETVAFELAMPPVAADVREAMGGGPRLVRNGKISVELSKEDFGALYAAELSKRHPRSAVGYDRAGKRLFLVMVEGRRGASRGMTFGELSDLMVKLGSWQAMAFDGGGSAALFVAEKGMVSQSMGSQGRVEERAVADALLITATKRK